MKNKRILVINPNTAQDTAVAMEKACSEIASPGTTVKSIAIHARPDFVAHKVFSYVDLAICTVETVKLAIQNSSDFDGIIIAGFSDVGCDAIKEMLDIPVLGIAETSYHIAALVSHRFSVLTGTDKWTPPKDDYVRAMGIEAKVASFRAYSEWTDNDDLETIKNRLLCVARKCIQDDGAEAIILGGGPLVGYGKLIEQELGIPVIDPTLATFKFMEAMLDIGLKHSKIRRWKAPLAELGDTSGAIPYNRGWLNEK